MNQTCLNCGALCHEKFCGNCGQKITTKRITFDALVHDIPHSTLHIDKGFFYTFFQLIKRPGKAIAEYLAGKRVNHYRPLGYLLILTAASSLVSHLKSGYFKDRLTTYASVREYMFSPVLSDFFNHYPSLMFCLLVPFISIWTYLFNRKSGYNFSENLVINIYIIAQFNLFLILLSIYRMIIHVPGGTVTPILTAFIFYSAFVYSGIFRVKPPFTFMGTLNKIGMYVMVVLTFITLLSVCGFMTPWWDF